MTGQFGFLNIPLPFARLIRFRIRGARACHGEASGDGRIGRQSFAKDETTAKARGIMAAFAPGSTACTRSTSQRAAVGPKEARRENSGGARCRRRPAATTPWPAGSRARSARNHCHPYAHRNLFLLLRRRQDAHAEGNHRRGAGLVLRASAGRGARIHQRPAAHAACSGSATAPTCCPGTSNGAAIRTSSRARTTPNITATTRRADAARTMRHEMRRLFLNC